MASDAVSESRDMSVREWHGVGVSDGVAVGRVLRLHDGPRSLYRRTIADPAAEITRLQHALNLAHEQVAHIKARAARSLGSEHAYIFDAHLAILEDRKLIGEAESCIRDQRVNAEWAVKVVTDRLLSVYAQFTDEYLRERGSDIEDVARRVLKLLGGAPQERRGMTEDAVIVAEELMPSTLAELDFKRVRAVVADTGGWTSHAAIIARGLGIPAIVGARDLYRSARTGDAIIVDATRGRVTLHPDEARMRQLAGATHAATAGAAMQAAHPAQAARREPLFTIDGEEVALRANVELPAEYAGVSTSGARGIGLYRSEFLWSQHNRMPTEDEQYETYAEVARVAAPDPATIRLFDFGGDKFALEGLEPERNPALGLRAIRLGLRHDEMLRTQVRALLRVAHVALVGVVLPMIADTGDVRRARLVIEEERRKLASEGVPSGELRVGAMIEVPSAVMTVERIAEEVDFLSLGTNDLVQYTLAVDRGNDAVAAWFRTLHPAVLAGIRRTLDAARAQGIPAIVCGEMAAAPAYAYVLVGLGARDLSMATPAIGRVRSMIEHISAADARQLADSCLGCATADEVEHLVRTHLVEKASHIFPPEMLP